MPNAGASFASPPDSPLFSTAVVLRVRQANSTASAGPGCLARWRCCTTPIPTHEGVFAARAIGASTSAYRRGRRDLAILAGLSPLVRRLLQPTRIGSVPFRCTVLGQITVSAWRIACQSTQFSCAPPPASSATSASRSAVSTVNPYSSFTRITRSANHAPCRVGIHSAASLAPF